MEPISAVYLGYFDVDSNREEGRAIAQSAVEKMDYILGVLRRLGLTTRVVSPSVTHNSTGCRGKTVELGGGDTLTLFRTLPWGGKARRVLSVLGMRLHLFAWLLLNCNRGQNVIVYHSLGYAGIVAIAKRIRGFRLVLEVEEIYADVIGDRVDRRKEYRVFRQADAFILSTQLLRGRINSQGVPCAIVHGTYHVEPAHKSERLDLRTHVVYAGTLDPRKGSVLAAAAAAYLDDRFHIHIIGSGTKRDKEALLRLIGELSATSQCKLTYDGLLTGENYVRFLQSCDIGLSTQRSDAAFNETSFPSKVLSYLANGLRVVSIRLKALEESDVADLLHFYDSDDPAALAAAIQAVDLSEPYDSRERLKQLDTEFCAAMSELIRGGDGTTIGDDLQEVANRQ